MTSTDAILAGKYPAKAHARRVAEYLRQHGGLGEGSDGVIYLEAQKTRLHEDTDTELPFRFAIPAQGILKFNADGYEDSVVHFTTSPDAFSPTRR